MSRVYVVHGHILTDYDPEAWITLQAVSTLRFVLVFGETF